MWRRDRFHDQPDLDEFDEMVREAYAEIPETFRRHTEHILIRVEEEPDAATLASMGIASPMGLLGLYRGIPHGDKSIMHNAPPVDTVYIYRRPILNYARGYRGPLKDVVRNVLVHEIGHHFGLSDAKMHRIENED